MELLQKRVIVHGQVQGVGFRAAVLRLTVQYPGLRGWVRNTEEGTVEAVFSGEFRAVVTLVDWCRHGPVKAKVSGIDVDDETPEPTLPLFKIL